MKKEEVIKNIQPCPTELNHTISELQIQRALEKQNPLKPVLKHDVSVVHLNKVDKPHEFKRLESDNWHCPICDWFVGERVYIRHREKIHDQMLKKYCENCGQRIDWSEKK